MSYYFMLFCMAVCCLTFLILYQYIMLFILCLHSVENVESSAIIGIVPLVQQSNALIDT